ncbi:MAG: spoIIIJ-associated protein [Patescibacteria group bacterium]|jgi:spoIIIJ-associated protein|nr:spoIIIJ-associated protein [Patescibacteria group bacterium]
MAENEQNIIKEIVEDLLQKLEVTATADVTMLEEGADVLLQTEESGIIIGYHGEILEALQLISSLMVSRKLDRFVRISLEVGDYKKNRSEYLERLAMQTKDRVLDEGRPHTLSSLKSWERRIVHMLLQNDDQVISESMGEGKDRVLVVKPRE